ncbi:MAG TPA: FAD-dependent oxidoreductase [Bryobacteraceae bacterium]|jgi:NADPH-dependent 2,4-dienoyl-CoA reductase/sulfur reductase-like enzyme
MDASKFVIAGGGMVAGYAAKQFVELGLKPGELTILSGDHVVPYERPPLSKGFLAGRDTEESILINPEGFYRQHGIELRLNCQITGVDIVRRLLSLGPAAEFGFDKLILATGSQLRKLKIPGAELANVFYLRSLDDSKTIRQHAEGVKRAVVIGGGFIGMEVASVLAQKGIEVTMLFPEERIWKQFFSPEMSRFFEEYYTARGVRFLPGATVQELRGEGAVRSVVVGDGRIIEAEMVVAGIGVRPATDFLAGSALEVADGVMVNEYLESSATGILAAGDLANYQDVLFQKRRRAEHWDNAVSQGQHCARLLMGERKPFVHVPYFFSDVFDLSYEFWGDASLADQTVSRGDLHTRSFSVWWLRASVVVAAFVMSRPDEEREVAPKWIETKQIVSASKLAGPDSILAARPNLA